MPKIPEKLTQIRNSTVKRRKIFRRYQIAFCLFFILGGILTIIYGFYNPNFETLMSQPLALQLISVASIILLLIGLILFTKAEPISFEKGNFLKVLDAYESVERFNSLSGSSEQSESDLEEAERLLSKVSSKLLARKEAVTVLDVMKEVNSKYAILGKLIRTKIIFYLHGKKELSLVQNKILELADTFAEANVGQINSYITSIEAMPESGTFKEKTAFLESKPRLRSSLVHLGKFGLSVFIVIVTATFLSYVFQKPLSDFAPYILGAIFLVFVFLEKKNSL